MQRAKRILKSKDINLPADKEKPTQVNEKRDALQFLRGILATQEPPPTDEEILNDYIDYLDEKYR